MEEEKDGAGDAPPPVGASTDAAGAAPILTSKNAAKKAAKARAKAEAKAKARVEKGLDPYPPKNPRQKLVPLLETTRLAKLAGTKRADPEPPHDPDDASPSTSIKKLPKSAVFKRTNKDNEVVAEDEDEYYDGARWIRTTTGTKPRRAPTTTRVPRVPRVPTGVPTQLWTHGRRGCGGNNERR